MLNTIFADTFIRVLEKMESYNAELNFSMLVINGKNTRDIFSECLKYADEYAASIPEMDDNTYVMIIGSVIAQKHICKFCTWDCPEIFKEVLSSRFVDDEKIKYFEKIDEAFYYMGRAFDSRCGEYITGFYNEFDFFQGEINEDENECYLNAIAEAIAICPQYEFAYCFLVVEFASLFIQTPSNINSENPFSEYYYKASQVLDEVTFDFLFTGRMRCSYSGKNLFEKYNDVYREEDLEEERRKQYQADLKYYERVNGYIDYLDDKDIEDGCIKVKNKKYKIGIPYLKLIPTEERSKYLTEYFEEEDTVDFKMGDDIRPYFIKSDIVYRDEEKTYRSKGFQLYRAFSYYMPKVEWAPLNAIPSISSLAVCNLTKIMMEHAQRELEIYRKNLSIQSQLNRLRSEDAGEEVDEIIEKMVFYFENGEGDSEARKRIAAARVKRELGETAWNRLSPEVKTMLISAEISYDALKDIKDVDYSPATIPLTKALENILNEYIYHGGIYQYLCKNNLSKTYKKIYHYEGKRYCPNKSVTMGAFEFMFKNYLTYAGGTLKKVLGYNEQDGERTEIIDNITELLKDVTKYRNQIAHKDGVKDFIMKECREKIMLKDYAIIKNLFKLF